MSERADTAQVFCKHGNLAGRLFQSEKGPTSERVFGCPECHQLTLKMFFEKETRLDVAEDTIYNIQRLHKRVVDDYSAECNHCKTTWPCTTVLMFDNTYWEINSSNVDRQWEQA